MQLHKSCMIRMKSTIAECCRNYCGMFSEITAECAQ